MANEKLRNISGLFSNTRSRIIIIFTGMLLVSMIVGGYYSLRKRVGGPEAEAAIAGAPGGIKSIPGSFSPTEQYAKLQQELNIKKAEEARKKGGSAIPTIIRATRLKPGEPGYEAGEGAGVGFGALSRIEKGEPVLKKFVLPSDCSVETLTKAREEGTDAKTIKDKVGCDAAALKAAGYTAAELKAAGFTAAELRAAGFSARELREAGFTAAELKAAGFSDDELRAAGFSEEELRAIGIEPAAAITLDELKKAGCTVEALTRARASGIDAKTIKDQVGCDAASLKAAGFTAAELKAAGFSAKELKDAGFTAAELKAAGFSAKELKDAGFTAAELKAAGFSAKELKDAGFTAAELRAAGFSAKELKDAGFTAAELAAAGFTVEELLAAGFTRDDLLAAGLIPPDIAPLPTALPKADAGVPDIQEILRRQAEQFNAQRREQSLQELQSAMAAQANLTTHNYCS